MKFSIAIFKTFFLSLCMIANVSFAYAQTAAILPNAKTTFVDQNGKPLTSGTVDFYVPGTTTRKTTWQDSGKSVANQNPVVLDAAGRSQIWGDGSYRQVVKDRNGNLIWDQVTSSAGSGSSGGSTIGDGLAVGTILPSSDIIAPTNYQFAYGQALSRSTYPELYAAITVSASIGCVGGSPTVNLSDTSYISVGAVLESVCIAGSPTVISKTSSTITLSANATVTVATTARIFPYGNGDALTTFNLPDLRGYVPAGRCNMGGVDCANLNSSYFSTNTNNTPSGLNAKGGTQSTTLAAANIPTLTSSGSNTITVLPGGSPGRNTPVTGGNIANQLVTSSGTNNVPQSSANDWFGVSSYSGSNNITVTSTGTSGTAFSKLQPTLTLNYVIKVTPDVNLTSTYGVAAIGGMTGVIACGANVTCSGNTISFNFAGGVSNIQGMTGALTCGNGIACSSNTLFLAQNNAIAGQYVSGIDSSGNLTRASISSYGLPVVNILNYAVCDGTTNDTAAINTFHAAITGKIGYVPPGLVCRYTGILVLPSSSSNQTILWGYGAEYRQLDSDAGSANSGITVGPNSTQIGNSDNVTIAGLTINGRRAQNTNTQGSAALIYVIGGVNFKAQDVFVINGRADGIYAGGSTTAPFTRKSQHIIWDNVVSTNNYRNGGSIVGVDYMEVRGGIFQNTGNTNNNGPMNGIDVEPNSGDANSSNSDVSIYGTKFLANGNVSNLATGNVGLSCYTAFNARITISNTQSDSNLKYGYEVATGSPNQCTFTNAKGAANTTALMGGLAYDSTALLSPQIYAANHTLTPNENDIIFNCGASCTLTLAAASDFPGRAVNVKTIAAQTVVSASSNVIPRTTNTPGTAILAASAGNWARLVSDGSNWITMSGN